MTEPCKYPHCRQNPAHLHSSVISLKNNLRKDLSAEEKRGMILSNEANKRQDMGDARLPCPYAGETASPTQQRCCTQVPIIPALLAFFNRPRRKKLVSRKSGHFGG